MTNQVKCAVTAGPPDDRPGLAIIANCMTPYRANLHRLIAEGIPELKLHTLITHGPADFSWNMEVPESIHASYFSLPNDSPTASPFRWPFREWRKGRRLIDYLQEHRVQSVICFGYRYLSYLRVMRWCDRTKVALFYNNDSNIRTERHLTPLRQFGKSLIYAWWLPKIDGVMSMGELGDQFFLKYGARPDRLYRLPYWPDYERYSRVDKRELDSFRAKFGLHAGRKYLLFTGRLVPFKRVDLLLDAFIAIARTRPDWDLLIVGDGRLREDLKQRVPDALEHRVIWTGFLEESECAVAYHAAEVLVLPSDVEPWALVIQEALAAGRTVVASDAVGAAHELVKDRQNGRIFPMGDLNALENALLEVTDSDRLQGFQENSRAILAAWREKINPVNELRRALGDAGVLDPANLRECAPAHGAAVTKPRSLPAQVGSSETTG